MSTSKVFLNYTDWHDVDEEMRTISIQGGFWTEGEWVGITYRNVIDSSTTSGFYVASSNMKN